ncbi:MAG: hypothetical protein ACX93I_05430 [Winogradskyella sp.]|jgi:hypothetical protein
MHYNVPHKTKQFLFVLIKLSIVVGAFYFIYSKLTENEQMRFSHFFTFLKENNAFSLKNIIFLIILSGFNWFFEILKWQILVKPIKKISFKEAMEQSLGGLTASLITPNRIGDYGAKAIYYNKPLRKRIVLLNLLGNISQMTVTTCFGIIGLVIFVNQYQIEIDYYKLMKLATILILISVFAALGIIQNKFRIKGYSINRLLDFFKTVPLKVHVSNLMLALIRYLIFSFQFYFLLTMLGVEVDYIKAMVLITSMYLLASIVPSITIFDVVIKGSVAVFLFGFVQVNELTILSIITLMWLLNFAIPSVFGSYFVLNFKLPNTDE